MVDTQYDVEEWARQTSLGRRVFNHNFRVRGTELRGWELLKATTMRDDASVTEQVYMLGRKGADESELVRISVVELHHWRLAQQQLLAQLSHTMRPALTPGEGRSAVGDVGFVALAPKSKTVAHVSFARGNVTVSVASAGEKIVDVTTIAAHLDAAMSELPQRKAVKDEARSLVRRAVMLKANRSTAIEELPATGTEWIKIVVPDGELSREGSAVTYTSPEPGRKQVSIVQVREVQ